jgi:hypothetical protein
MCIGWRTHVDPIGVTTCLSEHVVCMFCNVLVAVGAVVISYEAGDDEGHAQSTSVVLKMMACERSSMDKR